MEAHINLSYWTQVFSTMIVSREEKVVDIHEMNSSSTGGTSVSYGGVNVSHVS